jgi:hypothetical protein
VTPVEGWIVTGWTPLVTADDIDDCPSHGGRSVPAATRSVTYPLDIVNAASARLMRDSEM